MLHFVQIVLVAASLAFSSASFANVVLSDPSTWPIPGMGVLNNDGTYNVDPHNGWSDGNGFCAFNHVSNVEYVGAIPKANGTGFDVLCRNPNNGATSWYSISAVPVNSENCTGVDPSLPGRCFLAPPDACEGFPQNWQYGEISIVNPDGSETVFCGENYNADNYECSNVLGYVDGLQLCADDRDSCEASGGFYGIITSDPDEINNATCYPSSTADNIPTCDFDEAVQVYVNDLGEGSYGCTPASPPVEDDPTTTPPEEADTDGDGIPDKDDPDIDGDGVNNSIDPDIDGDGLVNEDDPTPDGDGIDGAVDGGGSCAQRPSCTGDAIQCALLFQSFSARCEAAVGNQNLENIASGIDGLGSGLSDINTGVSNVASGIGALNQTVGQGNSILGEIRDALDFSGGLGTEFDADGNKLTDSVIDEGDTDLSTIFNNVFSTSGAAGSCPADATLQMTSLTIPVPFTFLCQFASLIRPLVLIMFGFSSFNILMRAF